MQELINSLPEPMQFTDSLFMVAGIFLVLIVVLNSLMFKPLMGVLSERERQITEGEDARANAEKTVAASQAKYAQALQEARRKGQDFRQDLLKEAEVSSDDKITETREKAMAQVQAAVTELGTQVDQAQASLKKEAEDLAKQIVSAVLSRNSAA